MQRPRPKLTFLRLIVSIAVLLYVCSVRADEESKTGDTESELAKKTQNPVADLISVPFQNNFNFGVGHREQTQYILNIQPVIPINLTENWNLITRTIAPVI